MLDVLEKSLVHVPRYFSNFWGVLARPRRHVAAAVAEDDAHGTGAWTFLVLSIVLTEAIRYTSLAGSFDFVDHLVFDVVKKTAILFAVVLAIYAALAAVRRPIAFRTITAASIYFYGVTIILVHLYFWFANGFRSVNPCQYIERQYGQVVIDCDSLSVEAMFGAEFWTTANTALQWIGFMALLVLAAWLLHGWFIWRQFADMSVVRCLSALGVVCVCLPFVGLVAAVLLM